MADYAASVSSLMKSGLKINDVVGLVMFGGRVNITNYNTTLAEIVGITGKFKSVVSVVAGVTDAGFILQWIQASGSFKAYYFDYDAGADGAAIQAVTNADLGEADFIALGIR